MRTTSPRIFFATATVAAALFVLLLVATGPTPSWPDSSECIVTSDFQTESFGTPGRHATFTGTSTVWVGSTATPSIVTNASSKCMALNYVPDCAVSCCGRYRIVPDFKTANVSNTTSNPDGCTTTTTTTNITSMSKRRKLTATTATSATRSDPTSAAASRGIIVHDRFDGEASEYTSNQSKWRRFQHEPVRLPDQFMARFLNTLMYFAEVITVDVISAFLFGRWRPRYYQRAKKNRLDRARRRRYRRFMMFAADVAMMIWDACVRLHDTLCPILDDISSPTSEMVSNVHLAKDPATLSTVADIPTSEVVAIMASARSSALVSIGSLSASISTFPDLSLHTSTGTQLEVTTPELQPAVSTLVPRMLGAPGMSEESSCYPRASLPDTGLDIELPSSVSQQSPLLLEAVPPTAGPSFYPTTGIPADGPKKVTFRAQRLSASMFPFSTLATSGCAVNTTMMPIINNSSIERGCLAVPGVNHLMEDIASPSSPTSPATRKHRLTIKASEPISRNAESMLNSLVIYTTTERSVITPVEEFGGPADDADITPPAPFFISERYTPESTCYVSAHGVAYTTITMSYVHRINFRTSRETQDDTPTTTQTGDVSDILFPASNARLRCKWSRECMEAVSSEYYRSSVEAVFVARYIPDETDMVVLSDLVTRHL